MNNEEKLREAIAFAVEHNQDERIAEHISVSGPLISTAIQSIMSHLITPQGFSALMSEALAYMYVSGYKDAKFSEKVFVVGEPDDLLRRE